MPRVDGSSQTIRFAGSVRRAETPTVAQSTPPEDKSRPSIRRIRAVADAPSGPPVTVPTRWLKAVAGVLLLPVCWVASETCFHEFARATMRGKFWASEEFYHFALGVLVWVLAFFLLPKMLRVYVFGHELTHALWVWAQGGG